jgi:hypothetical protein
MFNAETRPVSTMPASSPSRLWLSPGTARPPVREPCDDWEIRKHRTEIERMAAALLKRRTLRPDEIDAAMKGGTFHAT